MTKCQITCKSLQKSSKCQNFLRVWHLVIFRADQLKKPPCTSACVVHVIRDSAEVERFVNSDKIVAISGDGHVAKEVMNQLTL